MSGAPSAPPRTRRRRPLLLVSTLLSALVALALAVSLASPLLGSLRRPGQTATLTPDTPGAHAQALAAPLVAPSLFVSAEQTAQLERFFARGEQGQLAAADGGHTNNWAVLVSASKFWFNYRVSGRRSGALSCAGIRAAEASLQRQRLLLFGRASC